MDEPLSTITQATSNFIGDHKQKKITIWKGVILKLEWLLKRLKTSGQPVERLRFYRVLPKYRFRATSRKWVVRKDCLGAVCGSCPEPQVLTMKRPPATSQGSAWGTCTGLQKTGTWVASLDLQQTNQQSAYSCTSHPTSFRLIRQQQ
jgi:hypothetical protein